LLHFSNYLLFVLHLQVDVVGLLLLNASPFLVLTTDYSLVETIHLVVSN